MAKGRPRKEGALTDYYGIRFTPETRRRISSSGSADYYREVLQITAAYTQLLKSGKITPKTYAAEVGEQLAKLAAEFTGQITYYDPNKQGVSDESPT